MLSDVKNRWEIKPATELKSGGTILRIGGLRQVWTERMFRRLSNRLSRLRPPFKGARGFAIAIESDEFPDYSGELTNGFLDRAPYRVSADFDGRDSLAIMIGEEKHVHGTGPLLGELTCGPVKVRLHAYDLETEAIARIGPRHEVRAWLREWSGVSVYRDGFRVWPYGEPHDDWLRLDQRRVNNPVLRLSNNQIVGFVEISRDGNPELFDQTNREGLMNNKALSDLRRLIDHVFQLLESERQRVRHPEPETPDRKVRKRIELPIADVIESVAGLTNRSTAAKLRRLAEDARNTVARQESEKIRLIQGYNDLAATGLVASGFANASLRQLVLCLSTLHELSSRLRSRETSDLLAQLHEALAQLREPLESLERGVAEGSHRRRTMDLAAEIDSFAAFLGPMLSERKIRLEVDPGPELQRVEMNPQTFARVLHILASNSFDWLGRTPDARIEIVVRSAGELSEIVFSDNGPGIPKGLVSRVFDPMFSLKESGRGMGLTVAKGLIEQHGGSIRAIADGRRRGAYLVISLPRKRSRATVHS
jgi:signal transduction histidine kinase